MSEPDKFSTFSDEDLKSIAGSLTETPAPVPQSPGAPPATKEDKNDFWRQNPTAASVAYGLREPVDALAQLLGKGVESGFRAAGMNNVADFIKNDVESANAQAKEAYAAARGGDDSFDWWRLGANVVNPVNLAAGAKATSVAKDLAANAPKLAQWLAPKVAAGGVGGLTQTVEPQEGAGFFDQKLGQVGVGALGGIVVGYLGDKLGAALMPKLNANLQALKDAGIDINKLSIGQALGGIYKRAEDFIRDVVPGRSVESAQERGLNEFSAGLVRRIAEDMGVKMPKDATTQQLIDLTQKAISSRYDDALKAIKTVVPTLRGDRMARQATLYAKNEITDPDLLNQFNNWINRYRTELFKPNGMTAKKFKELDEKIGSAAYNMMYATGENAEQRELGRALKMLQASIRHMAEERDPTGLMRQANTAHAALQIPQRTATYVEAAAGREGAFTPKQLLTSSKVESSEKAFAAGRAPYQQLAQAGEAVLGGGKPSMEQRLTERAAALGGLYGTGKALATPGMTPGATAATIGGAGWLGTIGAYTPAMQQLLVRSMANRPDIVNKTLGPVASVVRKATPMATPGLSTAAGALPVNAAGRVFGMQEPLAQPQSNPAGALPTQ